jgi:O-antigen/teichoic acid export membrane protein
LEKSRTRRALLNTLSELSLEIITAICSFILPRLILSHFGSAYNGITQSISHFIGCVALLKSGIGSVTRAALYKPLSEEDNYGISAVANTTESFMKRIACIFAICIAVFAFIYPFIIAEDFSWWFVFSLVLILSITTFAQYYFGLTYQMILQADQSNYIISLVQIVSTIANTLVASLLIVGGASIHIVKLGSAVVFVVPPIFYYYYVAWKYKIDKKIPEDYSLISQRWDAMGHQLANFVNLNTDIIVVTVILGVKEVSVYTIYYMVANAIKKIVVAFSSSMTAVFGNMIAREQLSLLKTRFNQVEIMIYYLSTFLFTVSAIMLLPFITVYTSGIRDINYSRPFFALLLCLTEWLVCNKIPYEQVISAVGAFKKTRKMAYVEAALHIVVSALFTWRCGLIGVLIGYIVAATYRVVVYHIYVSKNIIKRPLKAILPKWIFSFITFGICYFLTQRLFDFHISNYMEWTFWALIVSLMTFIIITSIALTFWRKDLIAIFKVFTRSIGKKRSSAW